jgi:hypothetical protein
VKENEIQDELTSIRSLMERSSKFISLSGLSGVLAGIYALIGAALGYKIIYGSGGFFSSREYVMTDVDRSPISMLTLILIALAVLVASILTGLRLPSARQKRKGNLFGAIPAGSFCLIWLYRCLRVGL